MKRRLLVTVLLAGLAALALSRTPGAGAVSVQVDRTAISTALGHKFQFRSTISNRGSVAARHLIAHLNVLSLRSGVYVDPEDWSSNRTRYLPPIPAGRSIDVNWRMQAVNAGSFGVYVAVLPQSGAAVPPTTGPTVRVSVAHRNTLNSGGILPLALGIPAVLCVLLLGLRARRRRS